MDETQRYKEGLAVRRSVLGEAHVEQSFERLTPFNEAFQEFITRYAWGEIWSRPGLQRHTRSLLTLAMMVALDREEEFEMHIRAAFNKGVSSDEVQEVLLQTAVYCGLPAANNAFAWAQSVFIQMDQQQS
jgi:4-carboxymuconolactone decarboxylase